LVGVLTVSPDPDEREGALDIEHFGREEFLTEFCKQRVDTGRLIGPSRRSVHRDNPDRIDDVGGPGAVEILTRLEWEREQVSQHKPGVVSLDPTSFNFHNAPVRATIPRYNPRNGVPHGMEMVEEGDRSF
jgi:hypothetical protein